MKTISVTVTGDTLGEAIDNAILKAQELAGSKHVVKRDESIPIEMYWRLTDLDARENVLPGKRVKLEATFEYRRGAQLL